MPELSPTSSSAGCAFSEHKPRAPSPLAEESSGAEVYLEQLCRQVSLLSSQAGPRVLKMLMASSCLYNVHCCSVFNCSPVFTPAAWATLLLSCWNLELCLSGILVFLSICCPSKGRGKEHCFCFQRPRESKVFFPPRNTISFVHLVSGSR